MCYLCYIFINRSLTIFYLQFLNTQSEQNYFELVFLDSGLLDYVFNSFVDNFVRSIIIYTLLPLSEFSLLEQIHCKLSYVFNISVFSMFIYFFDIQKLFLILFVTLINFLLFIYLI